MSASAPVADQRPFVARFSIGIENAILAIALASIAILPVTEMILRATGSAGVPGSSAIAQHFVLVVGMVGGAIAARERRMLSLSTVEAYLKGRWRFLAHLVTHGLAAGVAAWLAVAGSQFVINERAAGSQLAWGIPLWCVQLVIPVGFALVGLRLATAAADHWKGRLAAFAIVAAVIALGVFGPADPSNLVAPALVLLGLASLLGAPIFVTLGGAALILFWCDGEPIASIPIDHYRLVTNPTLASIPLFTLAGYFLAEGGASKRLLAVFQAWFTGFRGGPALVTALACAFFTSFTGASGVTILALGGLLMPILLAAGYRERTALGLVTGASSLGMLFPPCLPIVLYAIVAQVPMRDMFLGGVVPGFVLAEVASTFNEQLLAHYMIQHARTKEEKASILNHEIDSIRATIVRQTMFAEFEKITHEMAESGEPLTVASFKSVYRELLTAYFGPDFVVDDELALECFRIPHFYRAFYVYKYATGLSAAIALSKRVLEGGKAELDAYLGFLRGGSSKDPLDLLKGAGVDMSQPEPVETALVQFGDLVKQLDELI